MKKKWERVKEFLGEIWLGRWGNKYDYDDEDREPEEDDSNFRLKWEIKIPEEESRGK